MAAPLSYSQHLRAIGQKLESMGAEDYSVRTSDAGYVVSGLRRVQPPAQDPAGRGFWQRLRGAGRPAEPASPTQELFELRLSPDEIAKVDAAGREQRTSDSPAAEAHASSQILRAVGAFVDQKQGRFLAVSKQGPDIAIEYETVGHRPATEKFTVATLYNFWVKMYLKRSQR
jgi:hypothetical protein